ncbi:hypothetical protein [Candidatus Fukatsuia endosymbiont of Tuberolachnus salignus]|uniref:hypothetical protein n=1 Tax=Candidatus Fukatsuia endosymbiont of Tuberolachnus salignus TaxID=3077957 RepID=UPI00313AA5D2
MPNIINIHQQSPLSPENLPVITYHKQRVITTEQHYHKVEGEELKAFRNQLTVNRLINIQHAGVIPRWVSFRLSGGKCPQITLHL